MSVHYIKKFQKCIFSFLWNGKVEPLARKTAHLSKLSGGLNVVNIDLKLKALRLKHMQDIVNNKDVKFVKFSVYWMGYSLRCYNNKLASLTIPHSDLLSPFYSYCLHVLKLFKDKCTDNEIGCLSTKILYNLLLESEEYVPIIVQRSPNTEFKFVFKNIFDKFIDKFSRDIMFKIVHRILPVNSLMFNYNIYKCNKCTFCARSPETLQHLYLNVKMYLSCGFANKLDIFSF